MVSYGQGEGSSSWNRERLCDFLDCQQSLAHYASKKNAHIEPSHSECCSKMLSPPTHCGWLCKGGFSTGTACYCVDWRESQLLGDKYTQSGLCWELCTQPWDSWGAPCQFLALTHCQVGETWMKHLGESHRNMQETEQRVTFISCRLPASAFTWGNCLLFFCTLASGSPIPSSHQPSWWLSYLFSSGPDSASLPLELQGLDHSG